MKIIYLLFFLFLSIVSLSQQSDSQLAYTYYQNKEYEKAGELFLKLYERTRASNFLDYHIICLINAKQYDKAENVLKKFLKTDGNNKDFLLNLGYIYEQQGKNKKSEEYYQKAIQKLPPSVSMIQSLAYKFRDIREYGWAIKTYEHGRELLKQPNAFLSEIGDNYMMERNYDKMFALFIQSLESKPTEISRIISKLNFARSYDIINSVDVVIEKNLEQICKDPNYNPVFDELAVWYDLQKSRFPEALHHATRLNEKQTNKTNIFLDIARAAASSHRYDITLQAYNKILAQGEKDNPFYYTAEKEILQCKYEEYEQQKTDSNHYFNLVQECKNFLNKHGYTNNSLNIVLLTSDIFAYRLAQPDSAILLLQKGESIRGISSGSRYSIKAKRADLLAFIDNPWEATILYTQIEKANPNNDIGYEAKLKKAWLAYYSGDLLWAKAQFDVLKGATSKLISNDAIKMAHFLNSSYDEETKDHSLLEKLATAEYLIYKKQEKTALPILDTIIQNDLPEVSDYATLLKARLFMDNFQPKEAVPLLQKLKNESSQTYIQAEAIYELAKLKTEMQELDQALDLYKILVSDYSGSVYSVEAGKKYRETETVLLNRKQETDETKESLKTKK